MQSIIRRNAGAAQQSDLDDLESWKDRDKYGHKIKAVKSADGTTLKHMINKTMMRIELPQPLAPNETFKLPSIGIIT